MEAVTTRLRVRVAPGAARFDVPVLGVEPEKIKRRLSSAARKERRA